ncbi:MAG TPA: hypothetical protein VFP54_09085 [Acidimicrobiales bacterium]|nr:hypothetical protein [Acidimicrobiales bacterium]
MRSRWLSGRALLAHAALAIWVPGCLYAGWWQATRALDGNGLSYVYSVEWPALAVFAVVVWWNFVHDDPESTGSRGLRLRAGPAEHKVQVPQAVRRAEAEDPELAAYNAYLASLAAGPAKTWRKR